MVERGRLLLAMYLIEATPFYTVITAPASKLIQLQP